MDKLIKNSLGFDSDLYIYQDKSMFNYSVDTILLGNFVKLSNKITRILEIGTNNGALSVFLAARNKNNRIVAVEIQERAVQIAQKNVELNKMTDQIQLINQDFNIFYKEWNKNNNPKFQSIVCNPPFYPYDKTKSKTKSSMEKLIATHEIHLNLDQLICGSSKLLEQKGYLSLVLPVERLVDCFESMRKYKIEPKRVQFILPRVDDKPKFALIEGRLGAGWGVHFQPNLYLHDPNDKLNHDYLDSIKALYKPIIVGEKADE
ncbi:tRNA1(Val) (adenine(37)-N6)-methyltransferase [Mycoplasmopsis pullorum]|uniref:Lactate dehydrogenase n=1 Tax=Mycoplasmopsis pullorum TaxID=48003 RepID=A0A1L4FS90_9BACT|nr:tRNA1(Val) (adenine(37)-N6)-methyltransferase [Mycoplasmopsis pullorum]APJ38449.1 lactate dehydrogenase [Mycoplasmopsis pullorum]TNK83540.1 tRNA1(Val) (adenine(37)-N6)-methyltransferase [Mycoplasmopsis pullorum]TNK92004.1 tRNA1(Val) (adenine(37)-N6)-methyltransferase [Mycoplasmopsis pullorum]